MTTAVQPEALAGPRREDMRLESVLAALSDPIRLLIVRKLADTPDEQHPCGAFGLPVGKSTASHHFRVLREAGVISQHAQGRQKMTELRREDLAARFPGLLDSILSAS